MSVSMSRTLKTNPVLTWPERAATQAHTTRASAARAWRTRTRPGNEGRRDGRDAGQVDAGAPRVAARHARDGHDGGGAGWIVIIVFVFDLMADQQVCWGYVAQP